MGPITCKTFTAAYPDRFAAMQEASPIERTAPPVWSHHRIQLRHLARQLEAEADRLPASRVIDLGCGSRPYRGLFRGEYVGLDLGVQHGQPDVLALAQATPIRNGSADVVLSTQQLEHVDDPAAVLDEAHRLLRSGGRLLLSTHGVWAYHPDPHDLWRWTEEGLERLVSSCGFQVEAVHRQGGLVAAAYILAIYPLGGVAARGPFALRMAARVALAVLNPIVALLDDWAERALPRHYASPSYLVVATRS